MLKLLFCVVLTTPPGLFHQAIVQSGSPLAFWAVHEDKTDLEGYVRKLASHVTCSAELMEDVAACLRLVDWRLLTNVVNCRVITNA